MLSLPELRGNDLTRNSIIDSNICADWVEASVLFDEPELSRSSIVGLFLSEGIVQDSSQELAHRIVDEGWCELEQRQQWGAVPDTVVVNTNRVTYNGRWQDEPLRSFFVMLAIQRLFPEWSSQRRAYVQQGNLFEKVVEVVCPALLPGWDTYRAGWSPGNTKRVPGIVDDLRDLLSVRGATDLDSWVDSDAKDGGLDLVCFRSYGDEREANPMFFLQCASGKNWRDKIHTPNVHSWAKYLNMAVQPGAGLVAPFVIDDDRLRRSSLAGQIVIFDRVRTLSAAKSAHVELEGSLRNDVMDWMRPRVRSLPRVK